MTREEIQEVYKAGLEAVIELVYRLEARIAELEQQVAEPSQLKERVKELEARLNQNSRNSNKPPSSDAFYRQKSQRPKSDRPTRSPWPHTGNDR